MTAAEQKINPCPFCGHATAPRIALASEDWDEENEGPYPHSESYAVVCDAARPRGPGGCGASSGYTTEGEAQAIAKWNARAVLSAAGIGAGQREAPRTLAAMADATAHLSDPWCEAGQRETVAPAERLPARFVRFTLRDLKAERKRLEGFVAFGNEVDRAKEVDEWIAALERYAAAPAPQAVAPEGWLSADQRASLDLLIANNEGPGEERYPWELTAPCGDILQLSMAQVRMLAASPSPAEVRQWQPIETAPKDGTPVLLAGCRKPVVAAWLEDEIDWWHVDDNKRGPFALRGPGPTHWMPLPAAPQAAEKPEGE